VNGHSFLFVHFRSDLRHRFSTILGTFTSLRSESSSGRAFTRSMDDLHKTILTLLIAVCEELWHYE
jgi:hypothetical protein